MDRSGANEFVFVGRWQDLPEVTGICKIKWNFVDKGH